VAAATGVDGEREGGRYICIKEEKVIEKASLLTAYALALPGTLRLRLIHACAISRTLYGIRRQTNIGAWYARRATLAGGF